MVIGFMAAGKSTLARHSAERLGWPLADADVVLAERLGEPIPEFFDREGEAAFRAREREVVLELLGSSGPGVVALGGGAVETDDVRAALADHLVIHVDVDVDTAWARAAKSSTKRPLARDRGRFEALYERRLPLYESLSRAIVSGGKEADGASEAALALTRPGVPATVRMLWSRAGSGHPVYVGAGALGAAGALWPGPGRCFVVADERALELHGEQLLGSLSETTEVADTIVVAPGEDHKTLAEAERVLRALAQAGMQRGDTLLALRRRRGRRPRRVLRGDLPARRGGGAGSDHGGRAGRLRLRRQDRRRPAGSEELRRLPSTSPEP